MERLQERNTNYFDKEIFIKSGIFIAMGILLFVIKGLSIEYVDANGILHENFFLIPLGYLCILSGASYFLVSSIWKFISLRITDQ